MHELVSICLMRASTHSRLIPLGTTLVQDNVYLVDGACVVHGLSRESVILYVAVVRVIAVSG